MASIERFACWTAAIVVRRQSDAMPGRAILRDPQDAVERPPGFLEKLYNPKRLRSFLGYLPPEEYEALHGCRAAQVKPVGFPVHFEGGHSGFLQSQTADDVRQRTSH